MALLFNGETRRSNVCMLFCAGISMSCIEAPKALFFLLAPDVINFVIFQYCGEYGQ